MITLPVNATTFKRAFLDGNGNIEIGTDGDLWKTIYDQGDKPFPRDVTDLVSLKFSIDTKKDFLFGNQNSVKLSVTAGTEEVGRIHLIWPDSKDELIEQYGLANFLSDEKLYVAIVFNARADAGATGSFPVGPLSGTFGVSAGGNVGYERLALFDQRQSAKEIITELFSGVRLPQNVDKRAEIPALGEILATHYGGYLKLNAGLSWGYSFTGSRSFEVKDLDLALDYALRLAASVSIDYRLAGNFAIEVRRGTDDGWARLVVHKNRESEFNFAADFGFEADVNLTGLPASADEFLAALLGTDAENILDLLAKAEKLSSLDELEKTVGKLAKDFIHDLSQKWIGKALDNSTVKEFLATAKQVSDLYESIDQRIIDLYEDYLDKLPQLNESLDLLLGKASADELKDLINTGDPAAQRAWELVRKLWNDKIFDLLLKKEEFAGFIGFVKKIKEFVDDGAAEKVRTLIAELKESFPLDKLFTELKKFDTPDKLKNLADEKLQGLVGKIIGKAFDKIGNSEFGDVAKKVNSTLSHIEDFKDKWFKNLTDAVKQSFKFNLHYGYTRADKHDALLDVEINLNHSDGPRLMGEASSGNFAQVLAAYNPEFVRINKGIFTHNLTKSSQIQINALAWNFNGLVEVMQNLEHAIEVEPGGLMHVYTLETAIKQRRESGKKFKEVVQSNFLLRAIGETFQPTGDGGAIMNAKKEYIITTLRNMAVQYDLLLEDDRTSPEELTLYLELGHLLGMVPDVGKMVKALQQEFPNGLGKVKASYVVRYDDQAVRNAFTLSGDSLRIFARTTARHLIASHYTGMKETEWKSAIGFAYLDPGFYELYKRGFMELINNGKSVTLPSWFTGGAPKRVSLARDVERPKLVTLFNVENSYVERLVKLDNLIDKVTAKREAIPIDDLQEAARKFVEMADDLESWGRQNTFFIIFDKLVKEGSNDKGRRESALILEITPPRGEKVTKLLMS